MADDSNITITLAANTAGVQTALSEAIGSFQRMRQEMQYVSDASKLLGDNVIQSNRSWLEAGVAAGDYQQRLTYLKETLAATQAQQQENVSQLNELTAAMSEQRQEMAYLADATRVLGSEQADLNMSWLLAADNSDEYAARLSYLREQLALVRQEQEALANDLNAGIGGIGGLGGAAEGGGLGGILSTLADIPILGNATSMMTGMLGMQAFNAAYQGISNFFTQGLFGLNKQTEQNVYSWRYTYGQGMDPTAAMANAQDISAWSQRYSMDIPFTRQSLMTAISGAAPLGLDKAGLAHYFPVFSDLAATHINPFTGQPVDLGTVVQAVRGAEMGYSRMLKYDLNITPEDLVKYGLAGQGSGMGFKITDMTTLLPALEAYSKANGWTNMVNVNGQQVDRGAAYTTAHSTFWGEWSSFLDRVQNLELSSGGGLFGGMKDALEGISGWMDNHQGSLLKLADIIGGNVAGGFKTALSAVEGLGAGLHASGFDKQLLDGLKGLEDWFADPKHQQEIQQVFGAMGYGLGKTGSFIGTAAGDFTKVWNAVGSSGFGKDMANWGIPGLGEFYSRYFGAFGDLTQSGTNLFTDLLNGNFGNAITDATDSLQNLASLGTFGLIPSKHEPHTPPVDDSAGKVPHPHHTQLTGVDADRAQGARKGVLGMSYSDVSAQYLQYTLQDAQTLVNPNSSAKQIGDARAELSSLLIAMNDKGSPWQLTLDPKQKAARQKALDDLDYLNAHPNDKAGDAKAYQDLVVNLSVADPKLAARLGLTPADANNPMVAALNNLDKDIKSQQGKHITSAKGALGEVAGGLGSLFGGAFSWAVKGNDPTALGQGGALVQALTTGLGGDKSHQLGSDFVQNLATGMQTKLPVISSTSQGIGTNIAQQIMQGAMQSLGVGSGGGSGGAGGISGIGPGSTLGDLVKWTVAEALQGMHGGVWGDGHTPGGFNHWGTYGFN